MNLKHKFQLHIFSGETDNIKLTLLQLIEEVFIIHIIQIWPFSLFFSYYGYSSFIPRYCKQFIDTKLSSLIVNKLRLTCTCVCNMLTTKMYVPPFLAHSLYFRGKNIEHVFFDQNDQQTNHQILIDIKQPNSNENFSIKFRKKFFKYPCV